MVKLRVGFVAWLIFFISTMSEAQKEPFKYEFDSLILKIPGKNDERFTHVLRNNDVEIFLYSPKLKDNQQPHRRDEFYIVSAGTGTFVCDKMRTPFKRGDLLFAAAGKEHRFEDFSDDLSVWVIFYGNEIGSEDLIRKYIQSINEHHIDDFISLQSDDFVFIDAHGNEMTGRDKLRKAWLDYFAIFNDYKIEIETILESNNEFVVLGHARSNLATDVNKHWQLPVSIRAKVINRKITSWQVYADTKIPFDLLDKH